MTQRIDGKAFADGLLINIAVAAKNIIDNHQVVPGLAVVLVGGDPASEVYVRSKQKKTIEVGMASFSHHLPATATQSELLELVESLNQDDAIHGILVQLPLPSQMDEQAVIAAIDPLKDVDGFHVVNTGKLVIGAPDALVSCTPLGCMMLIADVLGADLSGKHAVVIGRSNIVGKQMAQLLLNHHATVTICHSRTANIEALCAQADIVVAAVGRPEMVKASWIKEGAVVIDVGINRMTLPDGKTRLIGDVAYDEVAAKAAAITPVPGGVGPMTIACLLRNTLQAACQKHQLPFTL